MRILLIEDNEDDACLIRETLAEPTAPAQVHGVLLKLRRETPSLLAHEAPPLADYARKVSTKSGEDHHGWSWPE
jgi:hypothetical protein